MVFSALALVFFCLPYPSILCEQTMSNNTKDVSRLTNHFIAEIFQTFNEEEENLVFSPFAFLSNVIMLLEGASGETANEIQKFLNIKTEALTEYREGFKYYYDKFEDDKGNDEAAGSYNKIVVQKDTSLLPIYTDIVTNYYQANITKSSNTQTGIEMHSDTGILSHWQDYERLPVYVFLSHKTAAPFHLSTSRSLSSSENEVYVPMIPQVGIFKNGYIKDLNCSAVELLFEVKYVSLLLLLPDQPDGVKDVVQGLSSISISEIINSLAQTEVEVSIPQMAFVNPMLDFTPILKKRGIESALDPSKADFSLASDESNLYLKSLTQTAYFTSSFSSIKSVAEGLPILESSGSRRKRDIHRLIADHPFLFFLIYKDTGLVLLSGKVENPTQIP